MAAVHKPSTHIADAEQVARVDLAACHRLAVHFGLHEGIDNHLTALIPGVPDQFLLAPFGLHWSEVKASDFMVVDFGGRVVRGKGPVEDTALHIHRPIHQLASHARCVLHTHMPYATALCMLEDPRLLMTGQGALMFHDDVAYYTDYNGLALDDAEGARMARALGSKSVLMLSNHGVVVVGRSLAQSFERLYFLERAAQVQVLALSTGQPLREIPPRIIAATIAQYGEAVEVEGLSRADLHFAALKRLLDRSDPSYAG